MPARTINKKLPPASKRKRLLHAFYLAQPFLQFFALMAVLFVLGRCSPLSPSTDKSKVRTFSDNGVKATEQQLSLIEDIDINKSLADISGFGNIELLSTKELEKESAEGVHADTPADDARVRGALRSRGPGRRLLVLPLKNEFGEFSKNGAVRIDLAARMNRMNDQVRKFYFSELRRAEKKVAKVYLVLDDAAQKFPGVRQLPLRAKAQLGFPREERAFLKLIDEGQSLAERDKKLIESVLQAQPTLVVVLE